MDARLQITCLLCIVSIEIPAEGSRSAVDELLDDFGWQPVRGGGAYCPEHRHSR